MSLDFKDLNIIDLISEKHARLRKMVIDTWVEMGEERVSDTESYMMALIEKQELTVAQISRIIGISRQGAHKCAKGLSERGYIEIKSKETNARDKILYLSERGYRFCRETLILKEKLEADIINSLGEEKFKLLKDCLVKNWFEV